VSSGISIIITSYNQELYLKEALISALAQTLPAYEIIIVDDASTDGSVELIKEYQKEYPAIIKPIFNTINIGVTKSRNKALNLLSGDYFTFLDGDDTFLPYKLELEYKAISKDSETGFVFSNFYFIDSTGKNQSIWASPNFTKAENIFIQTIGLEFPGLCPFRSELVRTSLLKSTEFYDENLNIWEDFEFRIRLASQSKKSIYISRPLSNYRRHPKGLSSQNQYDVAGVFDYIFKKHKQLTDSLPEHQRIYLQKRLKFLLRYFSFNFYLTELMNDRFNIRTKITLFNLLFRSFRETQLSLFLKYCFIITFPSLIRRDN
jgi:glycosyltransferase involved in cell wall biosynthesis